MLSSSHNNFVYLTATQSQEREYHFDHVMERWNTFYIFIGSI